MRIGTTFDNTKDYADGPIEWNAGNVFELCICPACEDMTLRRYQWHDGYMDGGEEVEYQYLYPSAEKTVRGLPRTIERAYQAALRVRQIDPNAYGVLAGRLLDLVCEDRHASGDTLDQRLKSLADKGDIPTKLVSVAAGLRKLRNVGAHANLGELTEAELPVLDDLTRAILEYVYSAPLLAEDAEKRLADLKGRKVRPKALSRT